MSSSASICVVIGSRRRRSEPHVSLSNCPPFVTIATCAANFALSAAKPLPLSPSLDSDLDVNELSLKLLHTQLRVLLGFRLEARGEIVQPLSLRLELVKLRRLHAPVLSHDSAVSSSSRWLLPAANSALSASHTGNSAK